jgi:hypothetical protein
MLSMLSMLVVDGILAARLAGRAGVCQSSIIMSSLWLGYCTNETATDISFLTSLSLF